MGVTRCAMGVTRCAMGVTRCAMGVTRCAMGVTRCAIGVTRWAMSATRWCHECNKVVTCMVAKQTAGRASLPPSLPTGQALSGVSMMSVMASHLMFM